MCSHFGAPQNKVWHCFHCFPIFCHEVMGPDAMIFVFWMLSFKPTFSLCSFSFIKRLLSSSSLSAIRVVPSAYLRLLIFLLAILIPACASSSPAFRMMYSTYKLNKQGDNIQPWRTLFPIWKQSVVPCPVLIVASWPAYRFLKRQVRWSGIPISYIVLREKSQVFQIAYGETEVQCLCLIRLPVFSSYFLNSRQFSGLWQIPFFLLWKPSSVLSTQPLPTFQYHLKSLRWDLNKWFTVQFSHSVLSDSLWPHGRQASLSLTISWSLLKIIESVMSSNHLILCHPFLLLPSVFPSIRIFSMESALCIRWLKFWSFSFSISPSNKY